MTGPDDRPDASQGNAQADTPGDSPKNPEESNTLPPDDGRTRDARMADARARRRAWFEAGAPGRLYLHEARGSNICDALYEPGLRGLPQRLRSLCAIMAMLLGISAWKLFWYRLAGVTIGRNVEISYGAVLDPLAPWLITLEDGCFLGVDAIVAVHLFYKRKLVLRRVRIGRNAVVGLRGVAFASLGDGAVLGPNSTLLADAAPGETLLGTPARPV